MLLLKVSDKEYWLLELRHLDTSIGILELAFAQISAQGRAEIPEAGFEQGPVDTEKAGEIQNFYLSYGDGLFLDSTNSSLNEIKSAFGFSSDEPVDIESSISCAMREMTSWKRSTTALIWKRITLMPLQSLCAWTDEVTPTLSS